MDLSKEAANCVYLLLAFSALWAAGALSLRYVHAGRALSDETRRQAEHNLALALRQGGLYLGLGLGLAGVLASPSQGFFKDIFGLAFYAPLTAVLLFAAWWSNRRLLLPGIDNTAEVLKGNLAVGLVEAGSFLASGLLLKGAFSGQGGFWSGLVFFLLGQGALVLFFKILERLTPFNDQDEIKAGNPALGLHFAGLLTALGLVLSASVSGDFTRWGPSLAAFAWCAAKGMLVLIAASWAGDKVLLGHGDAAVEIGQERNCAAVVSGMGIRVGVALITVSLL